MSTDDTFPRQYARTQRFTLGDPRDLVISPDGQRLVFARSRGGSDPVNCLWVVDLATGTERLVADPHQLLADDAATDLPPEERARRERLREMAGGVTGFASDADVRVAAFALGGRLFVADVAAGIARELPVDGPVFDPRPDPDGHQRGVRLGSGPAGCSDRRGRRRVCSPPRPARPPRSPGAAPTSSPPRRWGVSVDSGGVDDGSTLAVCRVDVADVHVWHISNPADPASPPSAVRYPAAGTNNPVVSLHLCPLDGTAPTPVTWDRGDFPYLAHVSWNDPRPDHHRPVARPTPARGAARRSVDR